MKWCFRIYLIVVSLCAFVIAADPSVPQAGGKQYAEVINGNNALIMPADRAIYCCWHFYCIFTANSKKYLIK